MRADCAVALILLASWPSAAAEFDHSIWDRVLKKAVNAIGEVDYGALKSDPADLNAYVALLGESSPDNRAAPFPDKAHELAYWMNAYNAFVTAGVVKGYPTKSIRDLGFLYGFFRRKDYVAGGVRMSLQDLEHEIIRKRYGEPRIHFAIVCASLSCPKLSRDAFTGANLEAQLDRLAHQFIGERRNLTIDAENNTVRLSSIFKWFKGDFEAPGQTLRDFLMRYANAEDKAALEKLENPRIRHYDYDWSINDPGSRARAKSPLERELANPPGD